MKRNGPTTIDDTIEDGRCPDGIYNDGDKVERLSARLKERRAVATGWGKNAAGFRGVLRLAAAFDRIGR